MGFAKKAFGAAHRYTGGWVGESVLGKKTMAQLDPAGQILGNYDSLYKPKDVPPIPSAADNQQSSVDAADIARRLAKAAAGRDSTIRTSAAGALYSAQPKVLFGS